MKREYNLDFYEAIKLCIEQDKWIRGEYFVSGCFLKMDGIKGLCLVDVKIRYDATPYPYLKGLASQKFRVVNIATLKELSK